MIGSWWCLPESELNRENLAEYKAAGFTHFQTLDKRDDVWAPYSRSGNQEALRLCGELGLGVIVVDDRLYRGMRPYLPEAEPTPGEIDAAKADYPDEVMFLLYDEPSPHAFPMLARTIERLQRPNLVPLFPMHDDPRFPDSFEGLDYETYMRRFVEFCRPNVLSFDYYPFFDPERRMPQYQENFATAERVARDAGLPLWYYAGIVNSEGGLAATVERIRFQVNMALAHGATGILHFTYWDPTRPDTATLAMVNGEIAARLV